MRGGTIMAVEYSAPRGCEVAKRAHEIGVAEVESLRALEDYRAIEMDLALERALDEGAFELALPLAVLAGRDPARLGRGVVRLCAELSRRYPRVIYDLQEADRQATLLSTTRAHVARGAYAWAAGKSLRHACALALGRVLARAQAPDIFERIEHLGEAAE